jgi:hypothetical protein
MKTQYAGFSQRMICQTVMSSPTKSMPATANLLEGSLLEGSDLAFCHVFTFQMNLKKQDLTPAKHLDLYKAAFIICLSSMMIEVHIQSETSIAPAIHIQIKKAAPGIIPASIIATSMLIVTFYIVSNIMPMIHPVMFVMSMMVAFTIIPFIVFLPILLIVTFMFPLILMIHLLLLMPFTLSLFMIFCH